MGNGYTFELESAIFYCVALATCEFLGLPTEDVSVYGDDIIVPTQAAYQLKEILNELGFTLNQEKSFTSGPFRESCGADFFYGVNVRPFLIRSELKSASDVYTLANLIRSYAYMRNNGMGCDSRFRRAWNALFRAVPPEWRLYCPPGYGNAGFITEFDEATPGVARKDSTGDGIPGYIAKGLTFQSDKREKRCATVAVASALWDSEKANGTAYKESLTSLTDPSFTEVFVTRNQNGDLVAKSSRETDKTKYDLRESGHWRQVKMLYAFWPTLGGWI